MNWDFLTRFLRTRRALGAIYLVCACAYFGAAGGRLRKHSEYNHFVYLADGWLHGRLALAGNPPNENDWAKIDVFTLRDGRTVRGAYGGAGKPVDRFYFLGGGSETLSEDQITRRSTARYVSFPPFPAVPMLPFVAIWKLAFNDVIFTCAWAALNPVLLFLLLRSLVRRGLSRRSEIDDLWLTVLFAVGSVYWFASVLGQVWYTAHVVAVTLVIGYLWGSLDASRPLLAGLCLGLGFGTRTPLGFMFPFFLWEAVRVSGGVEALKALRHGKLPPGLLGRLVRFGLASGGLLAALLVFNYVRFERFTEFGHKYLNIGWQDRIQRWGLFNYHFLSRNLAAALVLLPRIFVRPPFVKVSDHGISLFLTSPNLVYLFLPHEKSRLGKPFWITIAACALPSLLYQNSGYIQFGYRFSLDYMVFFVVLLAVGNRPLTRVFKTLVVLAAAVNLFGAITFDRYRAFYYDDTFFPHGNN